MLLYSLDGRDGLPGAIADALGVPLSEPELRRFEDGECKIRPLVDPRGHDAYVIAGMHGGPVESPHDKLAHALMLLATLRDHGAARVALVTPYLAYARKDRRTKPLDPLNLRYVAQLVEAMGTDAVVALEAHNVAALENAFRCRTLHLQAHEAFGAIAMRLAGQGRLVVASPDPGGVKRAQLWREALLAALGRGVGFAMVDKRRSDGVVSGGDLVAGDVAGATVFLIDDLIASGGTLRRAAQALRGAGARSVMAFAAHGLFVGAAADELADAAIDHLVVTDSVPPFRLAADAPLRAKLSIVSAAPLFARAIRAHAMAPAAPPAH